MRTQFQVWSRPAPHARRGPSATLHDTLAAAKATLQVPADATWQTVDGITFPRMNGGEWVDAVGSMPLIKRVDVPETSQDSIDLALALAATGVSPDGAHPVCAQAS